ncbi:glycosyltransferase [Bacillus sp. T3]|uniref:glycosyltransferase n=1 Tax=Bacillus sp. T3 TaxID=467262 RepID=UPI002980F8F6|nr:glycosyltransferase [Bacillus sp. T3]
MKTTVVMVVYNIKVNYSKTFQALSNLLNQNMIDKDLSIIIYDNSPVKQEIPSEYKYLNILYKHDPRNIGIVTAYNYAFQKAKEEGSEWLLLLDHDTELTEDYFAQLHLLDSFDKNIAAVVPQIHCENQMISPVYSDRLRPLQGERPGTGEQNTPVMAINSGAFIRVSFLDKINGFNSEFPLDYLDHWLFHEIYHNGSKVWVLDTKLEHELSVMDYSRVSLKRYQSILDSEINFYKHYKKELLPAYRTQLVKRLVKQFLTVKNKKIAAYTLRRIVSM